MRKNSILLIYLLFLLSGCTGLIYEVVWVRELVLVLGGTTYAITTVLVAFMSGLALGSFLAGKLSDGLRQPGRIYGLLEICIGIYGLSVPLLLGLAEPLYKTLYPHVADMPGILTGVRFLVGSIILLLPTTFMGATLPILVNYITKEGQAFGRSVGLLYGINTFGAVLGTMAAGFWLIPTFGLTRTTWVAAGANLLIGLTAIVLLRSSQEAEGKVKPAPVKVKLKDLAHEVTPALRLAVLMGFALSGFAAMVYQIAWTRALIMSVGSSTYAFTCILSAFILGLALGSLVIARWVDRWSRPVFIFAVFELGIALSAVLIIPIYGRIPLIVKHMVSNYAQHYGLLLTYQFILIIAVTIVPTVLMGAIFPFVTRIIAVKDGESGAAVGRAYAVNTLGTIFGSFFAGFVMIRLLGIRNSIVIAALLNALIGVWLLVQSKPAGEPIRNRLLGSALVVLAIPMFAVLTGEWDRLLLSSGPYLGRDQKKQQKIVYYGEGIDTTVAVMQEKGGGLTLAVNGKPDASTDLTDMPTQLLLGHLPALLTDNGKDACVIGLGSGITLGALAKYPTYRRLDCVEISDQVIKAARCFDEYNDNVLTADSRVNLIRADGRNHLLLTDRTYDIIVSEPSNPWIAGVSNLFTREFFELSEKRLKENGKLCVWLQSYSISLDDFKIVVRTLCDVFDFVSIWQSSESDYLMVAGRCPFAIPVDSALERFKRSSVWEDLYRAGLGEFGLVMGSYITSGNVLGEWAASAPIHIDDNPRLEFSAARNLYLDRNRRILSELIGLQGSPFDGVLAGDRGSGVWEDIHARMDMAHRTRQDVIALEDIIDRHKHVQGLEHLLESYRRNPDSVILCLRLMEFMQIVKGDRSFVVNNDYVRNLLDRLNRVLPPCIPPVWGAKLSDIADLLERHADVARHTGQWEMLITDCRKIHAIDPSNGRAAGWLALGYVKIQKVPQAIRLLDDFLQRYPLDRDAGLMRGLAAIAADDFETALHRLEIALKNNVITPPQLIQNEMVRPLLNDPRFKVLLDRYTQTQPAAGPS